MEALERKWRLWAFAYAADLCNASNDKTPEAHAIAFANGYVYQYEKHMATRTSASGTTSDNDPTDHVPASVKRARTVPTATTEATTTTTVPTTTTYRCIKCATELETPEAWKLHLLSAHDLVVKLQSARSCTCGYRSSHDHVKRHISNVKDPAHTLVADHNADHNGTADHNAEVDSGSDV